MLLYSAIGTGAGVLVAQAFGRDDLNDVSKVTAARSNDRRHLWAFDSAAARSISRSYSKVNRSAKGTSGGRFSLFSAFLCRAPLIVMSAVSTATFRSLNDPTTPMFITMGAVGLNTLLGLFLVFGWGPFPKLGVVGAGLATLIGQSARSLLLLIALYRKEKGLKWHWPLPGTGIAKFLDLFWKLLIRLP
jgi:Na+-driven multidrug efflux pump